MSKYDERRIHIRSCAKSLFIEKGIEQTTFIDIARRAGVGEATVYRHFLNKSNIAMDIAIEYANTYAEYFEHLDPSDTMTNYQRFEALLDHYIDLFENGPDYFIYLEHFDNYTSRNGKIEGFEAYEAAFAKVFQWVSNKTNRNSEENEIDIDLVKLGYTFNISFLSLCQKLLLRGHVLAKDDRYIGIENLYSMKEVMMDSLMKH